MKHDQYIIWDWNGTLINDTRTCYNILCAILDKYGKGPTSYDTYLRDFRFPLIEYYEGLGFDFSVESYDDLANDYIALYRERQYTCQLHTGAETILSEISQRGHKQFILSAFNQAMLEQAVAFFGLQDCFSAVVGQQDLYANSKIDLGRQLIQAHELDPQCGLLIGDTTHDYEVARDIGVDCLLISGGHQASETLNDCGGTVLNNIGEVLPWLNGR
jgi:phosphoglycolate phosphatase